MNKIFYWSPFNSKVATVKSVINSAESMNRFFINKRFKTNMDIAATVAQQLLQIKAIKLSPQNPFTWASGIKSPIYCDNRTVLSYPEVRNFVADSLAELVKNHFPDVLLSKCLGDYLKAF